MTEEKTKKKTTSKKKVSDKITLSKKELTEAITDALFEYDKKKKEQEENKEDVVVNQKLKRGEVVKAIFNPKDYINEEGVNASVIRGLIKGAYTILQIIFVVAALFFAACIPLQYFLDNVTPVEWYISVWMGVLAFMFFMISRVVAIMKLEIERTKDTNFLMTLFASIIAVVSMIIAIFK